MNNFIWPPHSLHTYSEFRLSFVLDDIINYTTLTAIKNKKLLPTKLFSTCAIHIPTNNFHQIVTNKNLYPTDSFDQIIINQKFQQNNYLQNYQQLSENNYPKVIPNNIITLI